MAYIIQHNTPSVGYVAWSNVNIAYNGSSYAIANGNTNHSFVWWELATPTVFKTSNSFPTHLGHADVLVILNKNGTAILVPTATILDGGLIVPGTIVADALSANSVTGEKILAGTINTAHLAAGSITATLIAADAVGAAAIAAGAILADHIFAGAVTANAIATNAVTAIKINAEAVTADKIATDAITAAKIQAGAVTAIKIEAGAVTAAKINVSSLSAISADIGSITSGTLTGATIRTAASGTRIELLQESNLPLMRMYDADGLRVVHNQSSVLFYHKIGGVDTYAGGISSTVSGAEARLVISASGASGTVQINGKILAQSDIMMGQTLAIGASVSLYPNVNVFGQGFGINIWNGSEYENRMFFGNNGQLSIKDNTMIDGWFTVDGDISSSGLGFFNKLEIQDMGNSVTAGLVLRRPGHAHSWDINMAYGELTFSSTDTNYGIAIATNGNVGIGGRPGNNQLTVHESLGFTAGHGIYGTFPGDTTIGTKTFMTSNPSAGRKIVQLRSDTSLANGAGINIYHKDDSGSWADGIAFGTGGAWNVVFYASGAARFYHNVQIDNNVILSNGAYLLLPKDGMVRFAESGGSEVLGVRGDVGGNNEKSIRLVGLETYTTTNDANMHITTAWNVTRSTSSARFKKDIEPIEINRVNNFLEKVDPVWFRSTAPADNPEYSHYGYIAEDLAKADKRLTVIGETGKVEGIQLSKIVALLHVVIKENRSRIEELERQVETLMRRKD